MICPFCCSGFEYEEVPMKKFRVAQSGPDKDKGNKKGSIGYKCSKCGFVELYNSLSKNSL